MKERLKQFLLHVVNTGEKRFLVCFLRPLLWFLSMLYLGVITCNSAKKKRELSCPVISVGNLILGGTGKTPAVEMLARMIKAMGYKAAILSRGYGRKPTRATASLGIVSDGERVLLGAEEGGDEPRVLAGNLPGVAVLVGKDRFRTGSYAINNLGASAVILDDGYQHTALKRDLDIVTVDSSCPFGNGHLLPRGTLREPVEGLRRADLFLLPRVDMATSIGFCVGDLRRKLRSVNPAALVLESVHSPVCLKNVITGERLELEFLTGRNVFAVSSIGNPQSFEKTLRNLGAVVVNEFRFADHHRYTSDEIARIRCMAQKRGVRTLLTTQKDAVRLEPFRNSFVTGEAVDVLALVIELKIVRGKEILEDMVKSLFKGLLCS